MSVLVYNIAAEQLVEIRNE